MGSRSFAISLMLLAPCSSIGPAAASDDPASYCASVGTDDRVRPITSGLVAPAIRLFELQSGQAQWVKDSTVYRCMRGSVWLCNHGANLVCAKADTRTALPSVTAYCKQNPNEEFVPMVVTGHGVNHSWGCVNGKARVKETVDLDERGFIANQWKRFAP